MARSGVKADLVRVGVTQGFMCFKSTSELMAFFDSNPEKLISYVKKAVKRNISILGLHIMQLAKIVGVQELSVEGSDGSQIITFLNDRQFINPKRFAETDRIISTACRRFSV